MSSIRVRLLKWLAGPIVLVNLGVAALTYQLAWKPAQLAFDQALLDAARTVAAGLGSAAGNAPPPAALRLGSADGADLMWFAVRAADGRLLAGAPDLPAVGAGLHDGLVRGEAVRIAALDTASATGAVRVEAGRTLRARAQVRDAALRALVLLEVLASLALAGLVWFSVTNGLAPLARLRASLNRRGSAELDPIAADGLPGELLPMVDAFNGLLDRVATSSRAQHEFQANVAHQLRTPLAGLKLQLEWLAQRHRDDPESRASLALMLQANERLIRETNQLLSLARAEPSRFEQARLEPIDLSGLVGESVQALVDQAVARRIDLGFALEPAPVHGDRFLLRDLVDNLVDNALRYTPAGGSVTVRTTLMDGAAQLVVEDTGPGIPAAQRTRVFERFVRLDQGTNGSGLGLAIVRDIAQVHGARVELGSGAEGRGAVFTVHFPA
jgi:two-component system sensor histidine kinase TctE